MRLQTQESVNPYIGVKNCDGSNPFNTTRAIWCTTSGAFTLTFSDGTEQEFTLVAGTIYKFAVKNSDSANLLLLY